MKEASNLKRFDPVEVFLNKAKDVESKILAVYLFGSRARETHRPDSDYDLLIVVKDKSIKEKLYDAAVDTYCDIGADISLKIIKQEQFQRLKKLSTPFIENVLKEGIKIAL